MSTPATQEKITAIRSGARPKLWSGKYFIVRPLGELPLSLDLGELVVGAALSDPILRIVSGYLGMFSRLTALDMWYNVALDGSDVFSQRWHRDPEDRALIKTFLYLRDCGETNGPFCYVPGSHNAGPLRQKIGRLNYPDDGVVEARFPLERRKVCTGKAGTLIFCDTTGFHKGGHPTTDGRLLFNAVYTTNGSDPVARAVRPCILTGSRGDLSAAARYAVSFLRAG
jgi:hypothetical protein